MVKCCKTNGRGAAARAGPERSGGAATGEASGAERQPGYADFVLIKL